MDKPTRYFRSSRIKNYMENDKIFGNLKGDEKANSPPKVGNFDIPIFNSIDVCLPSVLLLTLFDMGGGGGGASWPPKCF